jgi:hypothetical protein
VSSTDTIRDHVPYLFSSGHARVKREPRRWSWSLPSFQAAAF